MIVLWFTSPDGKVGYTEADNSADAVKTAKVYKASGYRLMEHSIIND